MRSISYTHGKGCDIALKAKGRKILLICIISLVLSFSFCFGSICVISRFTGEFSDEIGRDNVQFAEDMSNVVNFNHLTAIADSNGFSFFHEETKEKNQITTEPASSVLFDGKTAYFIQTNHKDASIAVNATNKAEKDNVLLKGEVFEFDLENEQLTALCEINHTSAELILVDNNFLYYLDCSQKTMGNSTNANVLFRYCFKDGKTEVVVKSAKHVGRLDSKILYSDLKTTNGQHPEDKNIGDLYFFDTIRNRSYQIDKNSRFLYQKDNHLVYAKVGNDSPDARIKDIKYSISYIKQYDLNNRKVEEIKSFENVWVDVMDQYVFFESENVEEIYNAITDSTVTITNGRDTHNIYKAIDGLLLTFSIEEPVGLYAYTEIDSLNFLVDIYSFTKSGEENLILSIPIYDLTAAPLQNSDWWKQFISTSYFDELGFYYSFGNTKSLSYSFMDYEYPVTDFAFENSVYSNINDMNQNPSSQTDENGKAHTNAHLPKDSGHTIYLTFDDGPGPYTERLLDILKKNNVQATFFVTNVFSDYEHLLKREAEEGHAVGIHSFSHDYRKIYASTKAYWSDFNSMQEVIIRQTGKETKLLRFPGGSSNTVSSYTPGIMTQLVKETGEKGLSYFDWNVNSGDAGNGTLSAEVLENCKKGVESLTNALILCHDVKEYTVNAMDEFITWAKDNGYSFAALTPESYGAHHEVLN